MATTENTPNVHPSLDIVFVDQTKDARDAARLAAERQLNEEVNSGGRFNRVFNRFWKEGMWKEYYIHKYEKQTQEQIDQTGDALALDATEEDRARATQAIVDRFLSEEEGVIHEDAGEKRDIIGSGSDLYSSVKELISQNVRGEISDAAMVEEKNRILAAFAQHSDEYRGLFQDGKAGVDNIIQIADAVKAAVEHGESLDDVMAGMRVITGEARNSARTEVNYSRVDRLMEKLQSSKIGSLVTPEVIGTTAAIAQGFSRLATNRSAALLFAFAPPLASGTLAAIRESKRIKDERRQHSREMAMGGEIAQGSRRRQAMEGARYETVTARSLIDSINGHFLQDESLASDEAVATALAALAEAEARNRESDMRRLDLISYSNAASVGEERFELDLAIAQAKVLARERIDSETLDRISQRMGGETGRTVDDIVSQGSESYARSYIERDISAKDAAFHKLRTRRMAAAATTAAATSLVIGLGAQELRGLADSTMQGIADKFTGQEGELIAGEQHNTLLYSLLNGEQDPHHLSASSTYDKYNNDLIQLSDDHTAYFANGEMQVFDSDSNLIVDHVPVNADGSLPQASADLLEQHGYSITQNTVQIGVNTEVINVSTDQYLSENGAVQVARDFWYENNTPKPLFDKNELRLDFGGEGRTGINADGHYAYSVAGMTEDGSYQGQHSANWHELQQQGRMKVALSATKGSQNTVLMVDIAPNGDIIVDPDSPAGQLFEVRNGKAVFTGAYMEAVEVTGVQDGVTHMRPLATVVGENSKANFTLIKEVPVEAIATQITSGGVDVAGEITEVPVGIPVTIRRPLEGLRERQQVGPLPTELSYAYGGGKSLEDMRKWVKLYPERLQPRKRIEANDGRKYWVEVDGSPVERSVERERKTLKRYLERENESSPGYSDYLRDIANRLGPMEAHCRVAVNIPAWLEERNLTGLLSQYFDQRDKDGNPLDPSLYEVNIIVNRREGTAGDNSVGVVEAFISDYASSHNGRRPHVRYIDVELPPEKANVGYVRKVITDATLQRSLDRDVQAETLYIESEDADLTRVDSRVVVNAITKLDKNPHLDAVHGVEGRMPDVIKENDLLLMRRNAWEVFLFNARQPRYRKPESPSWNFFANRTITGGWNTAYTAEAYALIGGYENIRAGEDITIGERISMIRGDGEYPNLETVGSVPTRTESSPRRFINEIIMNKAAYDGFGEGADEEKIRNMPLQALMDEISGYSRINDSNRHIFEGEATMFYDWCRSATPTRKDAREMASRVLRACGYLPEDYLFKDGRVVVLNWTNVTNNLNAYRHQFSHAQDARRKMVLGGWKRPTLRTKGRL